MISMNDKNRCTGCGACSNVCPKHAIKMKPNDEGFLFPDVDITSCIKCDICENVCQIYSDNKNRNETKQFYAAIHKDQKVLLSSSSGGAFSALADYISQKNGVIIGCAFDENMKAIHCAIDSKLDYSRFCGSKYVQSDCNNIYTETEKYLCEERWVLFSGTPCQIEGLKLYLKKDYPRLVTVDLICHGVTSPGLWKLKADYIANKEKSVLEMFRFRDKIHGKKNRCITIIIVKITKRNVMA